ncbi:MAG: GyrI-like domain-containing protein [Chloroflexota bacterium]
MTEPEIRVLSAQPCAALRLTRPMTGIDIGELVGQHLGALFAQLAPRGAELAGAPYVRYHEWGDATAVVEIGFPVNDVGRLGLPALDDAADGEPGAAQLPAGRAVVATHRGAYNELMTAWRDVDGWMVGRGLHAGGAPWESYVDNPDEVPPAELRTEIVWPLAED